MRNYMRDDITEVNFRKELSAKSQNRLPVRRLLRELATNGLKFSRETR